jgi:xanthine dehydrogenase accessory factor
VTHQFFEHADSLVKAGRPFATATVVRAEKPTSGKPGDRAIVTLDGTLTGWIGGSCAEPTVIREALRAIERDRSILIRLSPEPGRHAVPDGITEVAMTCFSGGTLDIFIEPHQPRAHLVVAGSSPVAEALVRLGRELDYHVIALDPDAAADVRGAERTLRNVSELASTVTPLTFVVVATHGEFDEATLAAALRTEAPYVGLVASRRRGEAVRAALREEGVTEEQLARLKLPAGLDIGARCGDEIALSILAELVTVRRSIERVDWKEQPDADAGAARAETTAASTAAESTSGRVAAAAVKTPSSGGGPAMVSLTRAPSPKGSAVDTAIDPVCGMSVRIDGAQNTFAHEGTTYYFCCGGCRRRFAADPGSFLEVGG